MDLDALSACLITPACVVTQTTSGLIVGMLLFLVAAGVSLIFGVLKIVNFAHGTFYMLGGYVAYTTLNVTDSYTLAVLSGTLAMALFGILFERVLISRVYGSNVLMQLLVCYAVVLIFDDLVKIVWGPEFHAMGMPVAFQVPPLFIAGGVAPPRSIRRWYPRSASTPPRSLRSSSPSAAGSQGLRARLRPRFARCRPA